MSDKKPLLSISFLSCGRSETIGKCLESIKILMERVDSELIIVDTGCGEEIKALMSEYTDKIIPFTWCDDFSAARNVGLKAAKGEWFLYLDDDEWFIDTDAIEDFFLSGEYKDYEYACYVQRNYTVKNKELYTDAWVSRMTRIKPDIRFVSCIHEFFYPLKKPYKLVNSIVEHFGYCYETKEDELRHNERNTKLLLKMVEQEKPVIRWWTHLLNEYRAVENFQKIQELAREGLVYFKNRKDLDTNRERGSFYCSIIEACNMLDNYEEAIEEAEKALKDPRNTQMCKMRIYSLMAEAYYKSGNYPECKKCCEHFFRYYEILKGNEEEIQEQTAFFVMHAMEPAGINSTRCFYIISSLKEGDIHTLKMNFWEFGWNDVLMLQQNFISDLMDCMSELPYDDLFVQVAQTMVQRKGLVEPWDKILDMEKKYRKADSESAEAEKEKFFRLARIFSQVKLQNYYIWYLKILYADYAGDAENMEHYFDRMFFYLADFFALGDEVFEIAEKFEVNLNKLFEQITFDKWKLGIESFFSKNEYAIIQKRCALVERSMKKTEQWPQDAEAAMRLKYRYDYFFMKMSVANLLMGELESTMEEMKAKLRDFSEKHLAFYEMFFKESAFMGEMTLLTPECRLAVKLRDVLEAQDEDNRQKIGECLKAAVGVCPKYDDMLRVYTRLYADWEKERLNKPEISPEMQMLAKQIKEKIQELLDKNMVVEALQVLQQLKTFVPDDPEIAAMEKDITLKMS